MPLFRAITNERSSQGPGIVSYFVSDSIESAQRDAWDADVSEVTDEEIAEMESVAATREESIEWEDVV